MAELEALQVSSCSAEAKKNILPSTSLCLTFVWIANYNDVNNQQDATTFSLSNLFNSALHVSGDNFARNM